jgi:diguanylate cyclase (GGDEF)-like protein
MPDDSAQHEQTDAVQGEFSRAIVIESGSHGAYYRLVRRPNVQGMPAVAQFPESRRPPRLSPQSDQERRSNIGNFQRVLVAEHHKSTRLMLMQMLSKWGFEAVPARDATEVMRIVEQQRPPELIILGKMAPDIDAVELCGLIGNREGDYSPYILLLATQDEKQQMVRALESGAAACLTTPFEAKELRARLVVAARLLQRQESLISARDRFRDLAARDTLTGIWNRRSIDQILKEELEQAGRTRRTTGVLLVDLDYFKKVNDTHGHLVGDLVLRETSRRLKSALRTYDSIGRYGGEEFLVVVPGSSEAELHELAERVRKAIEKDPICVGENKIRVTLSIGAAIAPSRGKSPSAVVAAADAALYDAKRSGRNRTCVRGSAIEVTPLVSLSQRAIPVCAFPGRG